ncbi:hypothetical protein KAFR_0B01570 [Kazachstania africana CBS 2517]|uniref:Elongator complex protein 5 n=1 Tax=Kazachstania africana (strain ATCC 22294 / BCRC 22015 / CBS 2517 / CECT 1963 / NBRC 1671 / NRRL Y-8276) TaxID=1071382 RepID=H2AQ06_KAZAF|nr:hypothetical protein KAFR_0B01570 [Kazachstania africana CBS 2517]CCF56456.1 hypothetical protein KAFR_0B01570 [Kazachstania africana CBS 2517]
MASSAHNPSILLKRVLSLTEPSSFILCLDSVSQSSSYLIEELVFNANKSAGTNIIFVSFETNDKPEYASNFIDAENMDLAKIGQLVKSYLPSSSETRRSKNLVIVDSLNCISRSHLTQFVSSIASPHATIVATYHKDVPEVDEHGLENYPSAVELLKFISTTIMNINPILPRSLDREELNISLNRFRMPRGLNNPTFKLEFTNRRRSGRALSYEFNVDTVNHNYSIVMEAGTEDGVVETPEMLQDLATFNLSTSAKQKEAKDQVALPFLEAQSFSAGGAIVYEYEKDDDYDEEDPYEDPF